jgi:hypothetical protein
MLRKVVFSLLIVALLFVGCVQVQETSEKKQAQEKINQALVQHNYFASKFNESYSIWKEGRDKLNLAMEWDNYYLTNITKKNSLNCLVKARDYTLQAKTLFELAEGRFKALQSEAKTEKQKQAVELSLQAIKLYKEACDEYVKCIQIEAQGKLLSKDYASCMDNFLNKIEKADNIMLFNVTLLLQKDYIDAMMGKI